MKYRHFEGRSGRLLGQGCPGQCSEWQQGNEGTKSGEHLDSHLELSIAIPNPLALEDHDNKCLFIR